MYHPSILRTNGGTNLQLKRALKPSDGTKHRSLAKFCALLFMALAAVLIVALDVEGVCGSLDQVAGASASARMWMPVRHPITASRGAIKVIAAGTRLSEFASAEIFRWENNHDCCPGAVEDLVSLMKSYQQQVHDDWVVTPGPKDEL